MISYRSHFIILSEDDHSRLAVQKLDTQDSMQKSQGLRYACPQTCSNPHRFDSELRSSLHLSPKKSLYEQLYDMNPFLQQEHDEW